MLRFLQTGDWHLGQAYRKFDASLADRLRASRLEVIARILQEAERSGSAFLAVTGDQFDGSRPDPHLVRGMLDRIGASKVAVHMIPGNHDPCGPGSVSCAIDTVLLLSIPSRAAPVAHQVISMLSSTALS